MEVYNFIPLMIALIAIIMAIIVTKNTKKVDQGFAFNYFALSYRRKMIRTLITLPIFVIAVIILYFTSDWSTSTIFTFGIIFLLIFLVQLLYNYMMWKKREM